MQRYFKTIFSYLSLQSYIYIKFIGDNMYSLEDAKDAAKALGIKFDKFSIEDFLEGINIELEHGLIDKETNVTNNDLITTSKIALAHLNEFPNYYNKEYGLKTFENFLKFKLNK